MFLDTIFVLISLAGMIPGTIYFIKLIRASTYDEMDSYVNILLVTWLIAGFGIVGLHIITGVPMR